MNFTRSELKAQLLKTILITNIIDIILDYTDTTLDIKFNSGIINITQLQYNRLAKEEIKNINTINIYGCLRLNNPREMFKDSLIEDIKR